MEIKNDSWLGGNPYENFIERWSMLIAREFFDWLAVPPGRSWLDVGCSTGTLTQLMIDQYHPKSVITIDSSAEFISYVGQTIRDPVVGFQVGLAQSLKLESNTIDASVSGLVLNFVP